MKIRARTKLRSGLLSSLLILGIFVTLQLSPVHGQSFTGSQTVPMGTTLSSDNKLSYVDNGPANNTALKRDSLIKYLETGSDNHWDPGEPVVYDLNNDTFYESVEPVIAGGLAIGSHLNVDPLIKYVDISNSSHWQPGDAMVYDSNNNNQYVVGKPVIAGTPIPVGTSLISDSAHVRFIGPGSTWTPGNTVVYASNGGNYYNATSDPHLKYVKAGTNATWVPGESVVYDVNLTGTFANGDPVLYGAKPSVGTSLKIDPKILFVDTNRSAIWDSGEAIVYDSNANAIYETTDTVIVAASPPIGVGLSPDPKLRYVQSGSNSTWVPGETLVYDSIGNGYYNATIDPKITFWDINGTGTFHAGDPVIYDLFGLGYYKSGDTIIQSYGHNNIPTLCANAGDCPLTIDHHFHFVDTGLTGHWVQGDTVIYDPDSDHVYITGDLVVTGSAPANGTPLVEPVIQGKAPAVGTLLKSDSKAKFLQLNGNSVWQPGEAVVYDNNTDNIYDLTPSPPDIVIVGTVPVVGTLLSEPVVAGPRPTIGTQLKIDSSIKFIDARGTWVPGDTVIYHSGTGGYARGDSVVADGAPGRGVWQSGQVVTYDANLDGRFETGELMPYGTPPLNGTSLSIDPKIKYIDAGSNNQWISGDTVVYDVIGNGVYSQGDLIIVGTAPQSSIYLGPTASMDNQGRVWLSWDEKPPGSSAHTIVYFKTGNGTVWSAKQAVSSGSFEDTGSFVTPLVNSTMMVLWSSNRSSTASIFYRLYSAIGTAPFPGAGPVQLTSSTMFDHSPSAVQDRNGRIWVTWSRANAAGGTSQIYYKYYNGSAWSADFVLPPAIVSGTPAEASPYITQVKDGRIAVVWAGNATSNNNLYFSTVNDTSAILSTTVQPSWSSAVHLPFGDTSDEDGHPSLLQSMDGNFWIFFQRSILSPSAANIMGFTSSTLNSSSSWTQTSLPTSGNDQAPSAIENSDHNIWVFYNTVNLSTGLQIVFEKTTSSVVGNDLGVRQLTAPSFIRSAYPINVTSLVQNSGNSLSTGTLTLFANSTVLKTWAVSLGAGQIQSFYYNWTNAAYGRYTISSTLTNISPGNSPNNLDTTVSYFMKVSPPGDVDGNGVVNIVDLAYIAFCWQQMAGSSPTCNQFVDTDRSGQPIGITDLALAAFYYNKSV